MVRIITVDIAEALRTYDWNFERQSSAEKGRYNIRSQDLADGSVLVSLFGADGMIYYYICRDCGRAANPNEHVWEVTCCPGHSRPKGIVPCSYNWHNVTLECGHSAAIHAAGQRDFERQREWRTFSCAECVKEELRVLHDNPRFSQMREAVRRTIFEQASSAQSSPNYSPCSSEIVQIYKEFNLIPRNQEVYDQKVAEWAIELFGREEWETWEEENARMAEDSA